MVKLSALQALESESALNHHLSAVAAFYDRSAESEASYGRTGLGLVSTTVVVSRVRALLRESGSVLDVGGGVGNTAIALAECGADVTVVDISERSMEYGRHLARTRQVGDRVRFESGHASALSQSDASVDLLICLGPIHHSPSHEYAAQTIAEFRRVLKPDGFALASFANPAPVLADCYPRVSATELLGLAQEIEEKGQTVISANGGTRTWLCTPDQFRVVCRQAGLKVREMFASKGLLEDSTTAQLDHSHIRSQECLALASATASFPGAVQRARTVIALIKHAGDE